MHRGRAMVLCGAAALVACGRGAPPGGASHGDGSCGGPLAAATAGAPARQLVQATHAGAVTEMAVSRDGYLATASQFDGTTRISDLRRRALVAVVQRYPDAMAWDDARHELVLRGAGEAKGFTPQDLAVSPGGRELGSRPGGFAPPVEDLASARFGALAEDQGSRGLTFTDAKGVAHHLQGDVTSSLLERPTVVAGGRELVAWAGGGGDAIHRWSLSADPGPLSTRELPGELVDVAFTADGAAFAGYELEDGAGWEVAFVPKDAALPTRTITTSGSLHDRIQLAATPDGSLVAIASHEALVVHDGATGVLRWGEVGSPWQEDRDSSPTPGYWGVVLARDGHTLVASREDGSIALFDVADGRHLGMLGQPVAPPEQVAWLNDRELLVGSQRHVAVWDVTRGSIESTYTEVRGWLASDVLPGGDVGVARLTHCPGSVDRSDTIAWIDRWTGATPPAAVIAGDVAAPRDGCAMTTAPPWPAVRGAAPAPAHLGKAVGRIDLTTGLTLVASKPQFLAPVDATLEIATGATHPLEGFPTGAVGDDTVLRGGFVLRPLPDALGVWDGRTGKLLHRLQASTTDWEGKPKKGGRLLGIAPDGSRVAVGAGSALAAYALPSGELLRELSIPRDNPTAVAFGRDPRELHVGTLRGAILHAAPEGAPRALAPDPTGAVSQLVLSPDGERLVSVGHDGGLRVIDVASGALAATLIEFADEEPIAFSPGGAYTGSAEAADRVGWIFDRPLEAFRFEQFARGFHRPETVLARLGGAAGDIATAISRPPVLTAAKAPAATEADAIEVVVSYASARRVDVVRAHREGREVAAEVTCAPGGEARLSVPLLAGTNVITVTAYDDLGVASNPVTLQVERTSGARPALWIVSLGVGAYPNLPPGYQLALATADATGLVDAFRRDVGPGKRFSAIHDTVLLDHQVTVDSALRALDGLAGAAPDDLVIVFMAGHGVKPTERGDMLFVTSQASMAPQSLRQHGLGWTQVGERLARVKGRVLVLLDACHSGHMSQDVLVPNDRLARSLAEGGRAGVVTFAAAKGRQSSYEPTGSRGLVLVPAIAPLVKATGEHGFFTGALIHALHDRTADRNGDHTIQLSEWVGAVSERVTLATEGKQTPWVARRELMGDFGLVPLPAR